MSTASTRGNLFASFARRLGYVTDGPLDLACQARRRDPSRELADILVAQGAIDDRNRALIEEIVESHQGRLWVESPGLGQGATFYFTMPVPKPGAAS